MRSQLLNVPPSCESDPVNCARAAEPVATTGTQPGSVWRRAGHVLAWLNLAIKIRRERRQLSRLSDYELRDIGVTRDQVLRESYRGIADIPPNRLKRPQGFRRR